MYTENQDREVLLVLRSMIDQMGDIATAIHMLNRKWWEDIKTGERIERNRGELIALMHSELSELLEAERKDLKSDKLPYYSGRAEECADLFIRLCDYVSGFGFAQEFASAILEKCEYNLVREDHKHETRTKQHGKKF